MEDDVDARDALVLLLANRGYEIETAGDADGAIRKAAAFDPGVLICDWLLPGALDGIEVARRLKGEMPSLAVIFVTAHSLAELRGRTIDFNVHAYLAKPIDVGKLASALAALE